MFLLAWYTSVTSCQITLMEMYVKVKQNDIYNKLSDHFEHVCLGYIQHEKYRIAINYVRRITSKKVN